MVPRFCENEVKKLRSPSCCRQEIATFSSQIHGTWEPYFSPSLYAIIKQSAQHYHRQHAHTKFALDFPPFDSRNHNHSFYALTTIEGEQPRSAGSAPPPPPSLPRSPPPSSFAPFRFPTTQNWRRRRNGGRTDERASMGRGPQIGIETEAQIGGNGGRIRRSRTTKKQTWGPHI